MSVNQNELPLIPGYTVHELLGKGGMAAVYLATQQSLNRKVAIKILMDFGDEKAEQRFFYEARTVAALHHPHIIVVHDVARLADGKPYLAMEYLPGGDLTRLKGQPQTVDYALDLVRQVAEALGVVHQKGIVHRDIKPANILFRHDGSVVLSDFGIAKELALDTEMTTAGVSVGSPAYSSPEQIFGETLDPRSDIYSMGVVLLELLMGRNPFKGANYAETVVNHTERALPELAPLREDCQALLSRMLAKDPDGRYPTVEAMLQDLNLALSRSTGDATALRPAATRPSSGVPALMPLLGGNKTIAGVLAGLVLVVVLFLSLYESPADKEIKHLLQQAELRIDSGNLIEPEFENARYFYNQVLTIDPDNDDAQDGLADINALLVERYLALGAERFEQKRLGAPQGDNAVFFYRQVLDLDSGNRAAHEGLQRVVQEYTTLANEAFNKKDYAAGLRYVSAGLDVAPDNADLLALKAQYKNMSNPLKRFFNNVLKPD